MSRCPTENRLILLPDPISRENRKLRSLRAVKFSIRTYPKIDLRLRLEQLQAELADEGVAGYLPPDILDACILILAMLGRISLFVDANSAAYLEISSAAFRDGAWGFLRSETIEDCVFALNLTRVARHSLEAPLDGRSIWCCEHQLIGDLQIGKASRSAILTAVKNVIAVFEAEKRPKTIEAFVREVKKMPGMGFVSKNQILATSKPFRTEDWSKRGPRTKC